MRMDPPPTPEEAAAVLAALEVVLRAEGTHRERPASLNRSRWRLAGLFGQDVPPRLEREGALWSYSSWEGRLH